MCSDICGYLYVSGRFHFSLLFFIVNYVNVISRKMSSVFVLFYRINSLKTLTLLF